MQKINYATVSLQDIYAYRYLGKSFYGDSLVFVKILALSSVPRQQFLKQSFILLGFKLGLTMPHGTRLITIIIHAKKSKQSPTDRNRIWSIGVFTCRGPMTGLLLIADNTDQVAAEIHITASMHLAATAFNIARSCGAVPP